MSKHENSVTKQIIEYLTLRGFFVWRNNSGMRNKIRFGIKGSPDIIGITPKGRFIGVEVKSPTGKQSEDQKAFERQINDRHGVYILCVTLEEMIEKLKEEK